MSEVSEVNELLAGKTQTQTQTHQAAKENNNNKFVGQWRQSSLTGRKEEEGSQKSEE